MKKKILISVLLLFVALILLSNLLGNGWIIYHEGSFKGKVVDAETKEPIKDAVVVAIYKVESYAFIESPTSVVDAKEVLTNTKGEFYIPQHIFTFFYPFSKKDTTWFLIYKPGYSLFDEWNYYEHIPNSPPDASDDMIAEYFKRGVTVELLKLKTKEERMKNSPGGIGDMGAWKLPKLFKAINEERRELGFTGEVR